MDSNLIEKYRDIVGRYLTENIRSGVITLVKAEKLTKELAYRASDIKEEHDIVRIIDEISHKFPELRNLSEKENLEEVSGNKGDLEKIVSDIAALLIHEDVNKSMEIMSFIDKEGVTLKDFYFEYPEFK